MSTSESLPQIHGGLPPAIYLEKVEAHAHTVQFYGDDSFLLDGLSRFVGSALGSGDGSIVIAAKAHRDGLTSRLRALGLDVTVAVQQGRYISLDAAETLAKFMVDGWPDAQRFHQVLGSIIAQSRSATRTAQPRIAAFGEMVALLWGEGKSEAAIRLEQLWNDLARTQEFHLHCAYPIGFFYEEKHAELIAKVCAEHSHVIPDGNLYLFGRRGRKASFHNTSATEGAGSRYRGSGTQEGSVCAPVAGSRTHGLS